MALMEAVNAMAENYGLPVIYSTHPQRQVYRTAPIRVSPPGEKPETFLFLGLQSSSTACFRVVSDSGTPPEEASFKFPAVCVRTSTERPEAIDKGISY